MTTALAFIFVLGVLIFIHELGHFLVAKKVGIFVERFSIGFPPYIFNHKKGDTTYSIGLIPLGGFVKMKGENPEEETSGDADEFNKKLLAEIHKDGRVFLTSTILDNKFIIRLAVLSSRSHLDEVETALQIIKEFSDRLKSIY